MFGGIFFSTDSYLLYGSETPLIELSFAYLALGGVGFLLFSKKNASWPFDAKSTTIKNDKRPFTKIQHQMSPGVNDETESPDRSPDFSPTPSRGTIRI